MPVSSMAIDETGIFSVRLGAGSPLIGTFDAALFNAVNRYLEVVLDGAVLTPRQALGSVPYALRSESAQQAESATTAGQADDAALLEGTSLSDLLTMIPNDWSSASGQLTTTDQVIIGSASPSPDTALHVEGNTVVSGELSVTGSTLRLGPESVDIVAMLADIQARLQALEAIHPINDPLLSFDGSSDSVTIEGGTPAEIAGFNAAR